MLSYQQALRTIFQRTNYERQAQPPYAERVWRLDRMRDLLHALGDPQQAYRSVHIAGTKGKGSTTAMIESALRAAGYRTGMYTSPHLHTFRERIQVNGLPIPEDEVVRLVERLKPLLDATPEITVFETITAMAMCAFADQQVDWGVFEVGLGGRLDATNVLLPEVAVITAVSLDHTKVLGETLAAIAREKAGIVKEGRPVVSAPQRAAAGQVIGEIAAERHAPLTRAGQDWHCLRLGTDLAGQRLSVLRAGHEEAPEYPELAIPLLGAHQLENACTAVAALETLREAGVVLERSAVAEGLRTVAWPGRMELLNTAPLVMLDGAHNPHSVERLLQAVHEHLSYERLHLIFGAGTTHNPQELLAALLPEADAVYLTRSQHARATPVAELEAAAAELGREAQGYDTVEGALDAALAAARPGDLVLVTGSLFVVAEARAAWFQRAGLPLPPSDPPDVF